MPDGHFVRGRLNIAEALLRNVASSRERVENLLHFTDGGGLGFAGQRPPFHLKTGLVGIATELPAAFDERGVQRTGAHQGMGRPRLDRSVERLETTEHTSHAQDRILPFRRTTAMRCPASDLHRHPGKALVSNRDRQVGRLGHDRAVCAPVFHERLGADAGMLLVHDRGDDEPARRRFRRVRPPRATASIIAATPPFMSCAPRPNRRPSRSTGMNGSPMPVTPTVSV